MAGNHIDEKIVYNNSLLMVKDFNAKGELKTDWSFMTSADVPFLTVSGIIKNPLNPFTGKELSVKEKEQGQDVMTSRLEKWSPSHYQDKNRTYLYEDTAHYMHINKENIKSLIKEIK